MVGDDSWPAGRRIVYVCDFVSGAFERDLVERESESGRDGVDRSIPHVKPYQSRKEVYVIPSSVVGDEAGPVRLVHKQLVSV